MENSNLKNQIEKAVEANKLDEALENLLKLYEYHTDRYIVSQIKAQHSKLKDDRLLGIISKSAEELSRNKITKKILDLLDRFKAENPTQEVDSSPSSNKKIITGDITATTVQIGNNYSTINNEQTDKKQKWYQSYSSLLAILISIIILLFGNNLLGRYSNSVVCKKELLVDSLDECLNPFVSNDSILNILIVKFENVSNENETKCIGSSLETRINDLRENKNLRVNAVYCDEILSPTNQDQAKEIRKKYNADQLIYGYANVKEICTADVEFCFNFTFADSIRNISSHPKHINIQKFENFEELFTGELSIDGKSLEAWLLPYIALKDKDLDDAIELFEDKKRKEINDNVTSEELYSFAAHAYSNLDYTKSEKYINKQFKINYKNIEARRHLIFIYHIQDDYSEIIAHSDTLFEITRFKDDELCPNRNDFFYRGLANESCGNNYKAIRDLTQVIEYKSQCGKLEIRILANCTVDSDLVKAYLIRGRCHAKLGNTENAIQDFAKVVKLDETQEKKVEELITKYQLQNYQ